MTREQEINKLVENGEFSVMTECAYGQAVADSEKENILKNKKKKEKEQNN